MNFSRENQLKNIDQNNVYDLLVIGGGVVGAAILEMSSNSGINSILIEKNDFSSGASSRSTKLLHGGIRYLPQLRFGLVRESLKEQKILKKLLGDLYIPINLLAPIYEDDGFADLPKILQKNFIISISFKVGLMLYDMLGSRKKIERHRNITKQNTAQLLPMLKKEKLKTSYLFQDAQTDDAKLVLSLLRNSVEINGSTGINYMEITNIEKQSEFYLVALRDKIEKKNYMIRVKKIIAATGVHNLPKGYTKKSSKIKHSGGAHIVLKGDPLRIEGNGVLLPKTEDGRVMFILPWFGNTIVGTTDTEKFSGSLDNPYANEKDIAYLKYHVIKYFNVSHVEHISSWSGVRALIDESSTSTKNISRGHFIKEIDNGFIQIAGGKLTGFRVIAKESLEAIYPKNFSLSKLRFVDELMNIENKYNKNDLEKCINHYCVAKPIDYMLRRTHLSWFQKGGGEEELDKIIKKFDIPNIKQETIKELKRESLVS